MIEKKVRIYIRNEDIEHGQPGVRGCPVQRAVVRALPEIHGWLVEDVQVELKYLKVVTEDRGVWSAKISTTLKDWIEWYDDTYRWHGARSYQFTLQPVPGTL